MLSPDYLSRNDLPSRICPGFRLESMALLPSPPSPNTPGQTPRNALGRRAAWQYSKACLGHQGSGLCHPTPPGPHRGDPPFVSCAQAFPGLVGPSLPAAWGGVCCPEQLLPRSWFLPSWLKCKIRRSLSFTCRFQSLGTSNEVTVVSNSCPYKCFTKLSSPLRPLGGKGEIY